MYFLKICPHPTVTGGDYTEKTTCTEQKEYQFKTGECMDYGNCISYD